MLQYRFPGRVKSAFARREPQATFDPCIANRCRASLKLSGEEAGSLALAFPPQQFQVVSRSRLEMEERCQPAQIPNEQYSARPLRGRVPLSPRIGSLFHRRCPVCVPAPIAVVQNRKHSASIANALSIPLV